MSATNNVQESVSLSKSHGLSEIESRIHGNKFFASHLRQKLSSRHEEGTAVRKTLELLSDDDLISHYIQNNRQGREHSAKMRAEKEAS